MARASRGRIVAWLIAFVIAVTGVAGLLQFRVNTDIESFLPADDPTVRALQDKARSFGGDPVVVIVESAKDRGLLLDREQLRSTLKLEGRLAGLPDVSAVYGPATALNQTAISAQALLAQISGRRDAIRAGAEEKAKAAGLPAAEVRERGDKAVAKFELRYGSLLVKGLPAGLPTLSNPKFVNQVIYDEAGQPRAQWHFVVPSADSIAMSVRPREDLDQAGIQRLVAQVRATVDRAGLDAARVTVTGIPAVTAGVADEVEQELPLLGALAVLALIVRFLLVPAQSGWLRRLWPLAAGLIGSAMTLAIFGLFGIPMSFGAIALLPLLLGIGTSFPLYLQIIADRRRVVVTAAATAAAFGSLTLSPLPFVRQLGLALAIGVALTVAVALTFGPKSASEAPAPVGSTRARRPIAGRQRWVVLAALVGIAGAGWATLPGAAIEADPRELARGLPQIDDAQYAERVLGSSGEINVVLRGPDVLSSEALQWTRAAESDLIAAHGDAVRPVLTPGGLLRFLGSSPSPDQIRAGMQILPEYITEAVVRSDGQEAVLNFGIRIQDLGEQGSLLRDLRATLPKPTDGYTAEIVGLPVAADRAYTLLSADRYVANIAGIAAAGLVLLAGLRRRGDALRGVLAAVLATGLALGLLALAGVGLTPLTLALGALTTVTACEFTVLLASARRARPSRIRRLIAWAATTSALGYLALVPSSLWILREYGLVLTATVLLSYAAAHAVIWLLPTRESRPAETAPVIRTTAQERKEIYT